MALKPFVHKQFQELLLILHQNTLNSSFIGREKYEVLKVHLH